MYRRIVLAYDGTLQGRRALREGALLAKQSAAQVFLLSIIGESAGSQMGQAAGGAQVRPEREDYQSILREGLGRLHEVGIQAVAELVVGEPASEIGAYARKVGAELVVVGHHRQSALDRWWSGPRGAYLIEHIHCSLLVAQNSLSEQDFRAALAAPAPDRPANADPRTQTPSGGGTGDAPSHAASAGAEEGSPAAGGRRRLPRRTLRWALMLLLPLVLVLGLVWYVTGGQVVSTDDAYIEAQTVGISTDVSGIVRSVAVRDNQWVEAGAVLYQLDDRPYRYALSAAQARLALVLDQLRGLRASYRDVQAQVRQAQVDLDYSETEFHRQQSLLRVHFVSRASFDVAERNLKGAQQRLDAARQQLASAAYSLGGDPTAALEQNPRYRQAEAQRDEAQRELAHTVVAAPFSGIVTRVPSIAPGAYLAASTVAFYLVDSAHLWLEAQPKETELTYVRAGQSATVTVDTYPGRKWPGVVESISPAASQQFSLLPAQNTSGNWVKVVQRIPLRVRIDASDRRLPPLRAGMSAEVAIDTGHARGWP